MPAALPLSMNLKQDIQHLSDLSGSSIVSSHYVGAVTEKTSVELLSDETMKMR